MYSRIDFPPGVNFIRMERYTLREVFTNGNLCCSNVCENTWFVFNFNTGVVEAIYYAEPNQHGWSPSEAHAKQHILNSSDFNPFELDSIP